MAGKLTDLRKESKEIIDMKKHSKQQQKPPEYTELKQL